MSDLLSRIYAAFSPEPLHKGQQDLYIDLKDVRGDSGTVGALRQKILLSPGRSAQVLTGHPGSGKSTELWQLRNALESPADPSQRYFVVQYQANDRENGLNLHDIDAIDILCALIRQLAIDMRDRLGVELKPHYFRDRWKRLKELALTEVDFDKLELAAGMGKITGILRHSVETRRRVREALDPDADNWIAAANDVIGEAILALKAKEFRGLVIIADDLDKMDSYPVNDGGLLTTERLFINRARELTSFDCHVIYTLPIELAYSHHGSTIRRTFGGHLPVVPMIKLRTAPPNEAEHALGLEKCREIIGVRLTSIGASEADAFASDAIRDTLIRFSGGQPTEIMAFVREAIITDGLPIGEKGLRRIRFESMRSYQRQLMRGHWPLIEEVRHTGQVERTEDNETLFRQLLESRAILLYRNDQEWYGLNPAVAELQPPQTPPVSAP